MFIASCGLSDVVLTKKMQYQVKLSFNSNHKNPVLYENCFVTLYKDSDSQLLLHISDQFHNDFVVSVNHKFTVLKGKGDDGFGFGARNLSGFLKFKQVSFWPFRRLDRAAS